MLPCGLLAAVKQGENGDVL